MYVAQMWKSAKKQIFDEFLGSEKAFIEILAHLVFSTPSFGRAISWINISRLGVMACGEKSTL